MKHFRRYIEEDFFDFIKVRGKRIEILKNPTGREVRELRRDIKKEGGFGDIRAFLNLDTGDLFVWDGGVALHNDVEGTVRQSPWDAVKLLLHDDYPELSDMESNKVLHGMRDIEDVHGVESLSQVYGANYTVKLQDLRAGAR